MSNDANSAATERFIAHNKSHFSSARERQDKEPVVLQEANSFHTSHIAFSYFIDALTEKHNARAVAYCVDALPDLSAVTDIYASIGIKEFLNIAIDESLADEAKILSDEIISNINSKDDILNIHIDGIWFGDLVYDNYIRSRLLPTIAPDDENFFAYLRKAVEYILFWREYFRTHDVRAVNVSHAVYLYAVPARFATANNIPAYQTNVRICCQLTKDRLFESSDTYDYKDIFRTLPKDVQEAGKEKAKHQLERRFSGEVGVDMTCTTVSAFLPASDTRLVAESPRTKIFIATPCFLDAPHGLGLSVFSDVWEWLNFLGWFSEQSDYDWYIKEHPDAIAGQTEILTLLLSHYPKIKLLPPDASHHQLLSEGIDVALSVHGSIGVEYAVLGVPVINASMHAPHTPYNFTINPRNQKEYMEVLRNLDLLKYHGNIEDVYEYYFMRHVYHSENIFFDDYAGLLDKLGGHVGQFVPQSYDLWLAECSEDKHNEIKHRVRAYIDSGAMRLRQTSDPSSY